MKRTTIEVVVVAGLLVLQWALTLNFFLKGYILINQGMWVASTLAFIAGVAVLLWYPVSALARRLGLN